MNRIDDSLEVIDAEEALAESIRTLAPSSGFPRQASASGFVEANATHLDSRPAFKKELISQVSTLLSGSALDIESLVDVLTLKDMSAGRDEDAALAIQYLAAAPLPEGRKQVALLSIWRRVYIYDDWADIAKTAGRSEQTQKKMVMDTMLYKTLEALSRSGTLSPIALLTLDLPSNFTLSPRMATQPPLPEELAARYSTYSSSQLEALMTDHQTEIARLDEFLEDPSIGFEERVKGVMSLARNGYDDVLVEEMDGEGDVHM